MQLHSVIASAIRPAFKSPSAITESQAASTARCGGRS
jgi:hypothetical protein